MHVINEVIQDKNKLKYAFSINPATEIIIDFYNVYCNFIQFDKYKIFTRKSFEKCLGTVLKSAFNQKFFVISKPIFEVEDSVIEKYTALYKNLVYVIVKDDHTHKSLNKERDDFICLLLNHLKPHSFIITNDKFINYEEILKNIKPFSLKVFYNNTVTDVIYDHEKIKEVVKEMGENSFKFKRKAFRFTKN